METQPFLQILAGVGTLNGFVFGLYLMVNGYGRRKADVYLGIFLMLLSVRIFRSVHFYYAGLNTAIYYLGHAAFFLAIPFIFFYYRSVFGNKEDLQLSDLGFFLPVLLLLVPHFRIVNLAGFAVFIFYLLLSHRLLIRFKRNVNPSSKLLENYHYRTHRNVLLLFYLVFIFTSLNLIYRLLPYISGALFYSVLLYLMVFFRQRWQQYRRNTRILKSNESKGSPSSEAEGHIQALLKKIEEEKLFTDSTITLVKLADMLSIPAYQLSQILNQYLQKSFPDFINGYRVAEARRLLSDPGYQKESVENIGYESGFNNPSSFFVAFKKFTKTSPARYRKEHLLSR